MAGAGTGKTRTLVERCLYRLLASRPPVGLDQILVVTFTEAAATEARQRIRQRLEQAAADAPDNLHLAESLALLDTAPIGTLHSFCLRLVREHFHELGLDPQLSVLDVSQSALLAGRVLDELLQRHYAGSAVGDEAVRDLVMTYGNGRDEPIRRVLLRVHQYARTLPDPDGWLEYQRALFEQAEPSHWPEALLRGFTDWVAEWRERLEELSAENPRAAEARAVLAGVGDSPDRDALDTTVRALLELDRDWPRGAKGLWRQPLAALFDDARFLTDLARAPDRTDPLLQDWEWIRRPMRTLLDLTAEFARAFAEAKRELAVVDFPDLEQFALRLLWDPRRNAPTSLALEWRARLAEVLVDEYQDINAAQDTILRALSREGAEANRFLVGDVKQSIYRFRLANPHIFQNYAAAWRHHRGGAVVSLNENFRSHPRLLEFVNALFAPLMRPEVGGVDYDAEARLRPGRPEAPSSGPAPPPVEFVLCLPPPRDEQTEAPDPTEPDESDERSLTEAEAALVARRLQELKQSGLPVWDESQAAYRPVRWPDMAVLLRAPRTRAETYAREFARAGVPLLARRSSFYESTEISDLLSLLHLLDNPLQDIPLLAVLRSPLVGLTVDELAVIRLAARQEPYWTALLRFHQSRRLHNTGPSIDPASNPVPSAPEAELCSPARNADEAAPAPSVTSDPAAEFAARSAGPKVERFLERYARWRDAARLGSLARCLEMVLDETGYEDGLRLQDRGVARVANVQQLLTLARDFDRQQRAGLFRFLQFLQTRQETEEDVEPPAFAEGDAVRLLSIHQSKGLEFPVVVVADLGKQFNFRDLSTSLVLDEAWGLAPRVLPPDQRRSYPSLPHWLAARRGRRETLGEELRLLYVAVTRARDYLILSGATRFRNKAAAWTPPTGERLSVSVLLQSGCPLDWLGPVLPRLTGCADWLEQGEGQGRLLRWRVVRTPLPNAEVPPPEPGASAAAVEPALLETLRQRLVWEYPHRAATREPAKVAVTTLSRRITPEDGEEAIRWFVFPDRRRGPSGAPARGDTLTPIERGLAHHRFLQYADWNALTSPEAVQAEAWRLTDAGHLTREEADGLDAPALAALGNSELGRAIRENPDGLRRELEFTLRLISADFAALRLPCAPGPAADEFVVVQGVVDLAVLAPDHLWIADFKTDAITEAELGERIARYTPQLQLYALALGRIYRRPVRAAWLHFLTLQRTVSVPVTP